MLHDDNDADDVTQDTLLKLWCMRDRLDEYRSLCALAMVVCHRMCLDRIKRSGRSVAIDGFGTTLPEMPDVSPEDIVIGNENERQVDRLLAALPDRQQAILRMKHIDGLEISEIARIVGSQEGTVRTALSRARHRIKELFLTQCI